MIVRLIWFWWSVFNSFKMFGGVPRQQFPQQFPQQQCNGRQGQCWNPVSAGNLLCPGCQVRAVQRQPQWQQQPQRQQSQQQQWQPQQQPQRQQPQRPRQQQLPPSGGLGLNYPTRAPITDYYGTTLNPDGSITIRPHGY